MTAEPARGATASQPRGLRRLGSPVAARPGRERAVLLVLLGLTVLTLLVGWFRGRQRGELGTATPPFVFGWLPLVDVPWAVAAAVVLGLAVVAAPRLRDARMPPLATAGALFGVALAAGLTVGAARRGTYGWWQIFDLGPRGSFEAANEYLPGLPTLHWGVGNYLDRFAEVVPSQPVNIAGHPPLPLLLMRAIGADTAPTQAALCIVCAALCAPLTYAIARSLRAGEGTARTAGLLAALSPIVLLDGVTSMDAVFAAAGAAAAALLLARSPWLLALGGVVFGACTLLSWALLGVGAAVALAVLLRDGVRRAVVVAAVAGAGFVGGNALLAAGWGYDPVATLLNTEAVYRNSLARVRPWWFWVLGSPVAWGIMLGPVVVAALARAALRRHPAAVAIAAVVVFAAVAGFTKAETERIWLIFVPLACVGAAYALPARRLRWALGWLAAQALVLQLLVETVW
ncbi:hypothetical protein [Patulibacter sp. SYSU D01012]|uniref:hypothetical protein n=1 Tax=Patulibacter sp. SYSU D01012 TaxID=2817381 RepID=UPI001B312121|nr:hypothetical protein [Patulibacter sp. SYSU D01012]